MSKTPTGGTEPDDEPNEAIVDSPDPGGDGAESKGGGGAAPVKPAGAARIRPFAGGLIFDDAARRHLAATAGLVKIPSVLDQLRVAGALPTQPKWYSQPPIANIDRILKNNPALNSALRWSDQLTPPVLTALQRSLTADVTAVLTGPSAMTAWREALASQTKLVGISAAVAAATEQRKSLYASLEGVRTLSAIASRNLDALTPWADVATKLNTLPLAAAPLAAYRRYLEPTEQDLSAHRLAMGAVSSFTIGGATASQVLLVDDGEAEDDELVVVIDVGGQVEDELITPWRAGQIAAAEDLRGRLRCFDPTVPDMLDGAWLDIDREGPGQLVKICACAVEALDRTLHAVAPDADVDSWIAETRLKPSKTLVIRSDRATLTRQARIRYLTRGRAGDRKLIEAQETSLSALVGELMGRFNAGKHASQGAVSMARTLLMSVEALLSQLVFAND